MELITYENYIITQTINTLLKEFGLTHRVILRTLDTDKQLGIIISLPSLIDDSKEPYMLPIRENYKESSLRLSEIFNIINSDAHEALLKYKSNVVTLLQNTKKS